jgi:hypothetical protein
MLSRYTGTMLVTLEHLQGSRQGQTQQNTKQTKNDYISFNRKEISMIVSLYSMCVAKGIWRDYALDLTKQMAAFSMFRHTHENPLAMIIKLPANTASGFVYEAIYERKCLSRSAFLEQAIATLSEKVGL